MFIQWIWVLPLSTEFPEASKLWAETLGRQGQCRIGAEVVAFSGSGSRILEMLQRRWYSFVLLEPELRFKLNTVDDDFASLSAWHILSPHDS